MWESDLARLQAVLIDDVFLGREDEPNGSVVDGGVLVIRVIIADQSLLGRRLLRLLLSSFDVLQKRRRCPQDLLLR